ncbi:class I adenylate-forming enzyme family protein [Sedimentitalea sp. XS_ASV28]|uniref:class I adenylate-forming enzyme family protein n=1 Tax=Sedimentitalea sp. XS_ASV28 TaxID=3241296 RepID=UPI0035146539
MSENPGKLPLLDRISDYAGYWAERTPGAIALRFGDQEWTYADLTREVDLWAAAMLAAGIRKGDRVAMLSTPRPEFFLSFLGAVSIGAIWVGLNPRYTVAEMARTLSDAEPSLIFALPSFEDADLNRTLSQAVDEADCRAARVTLGDEAEGYAPLGPFLSRGKDTTPQALTEARAAVSRDDPALIVYTSGSTGTPKGAMLAHRGLCHGYTKQSDHFDLQGASVLCNLPINHIGCVGDLSCGPHVAGGTIVFMERFAPQETLDAIAEGRIDCLLSVPTILQILSDMPGFDALDLSRMRLVCWGGAAIAANVLARYRAKGCPLGLTYGMSEMPGSITMAAVGADDRELLTTVGRPVDGLDIRLVRDDGTLCAPEEEGEIRIRHDSLLLSYFRQPGKTTEAFDSDGYFRTGDVGVLEPEGTIKLVGRKKEMFKSGGYNVYPREIEMVLEQHPAVATAAVISVPDETWQEVGWAFVLADRAADKPALEAELDDLCRSRLANYKRPKRFLIREALPMLPVGKVDKVHLKKQAIEMV